MMIWRSLASRTCTRNRLVERGELNCGSGDQARNRRKTALSSYLSTAGSWSTRLISEMPIRTTPKQASRSLTKRIRAMAGLFFGTKMILKSHLTQSRAPLDLQSNCAWVQPWSSSIQSAISTEMPSSDGGFYPENSDMQQKSKIQTFPYKISADVTFNPGQCLMCWEKMVIEGAIFR